MNAAVWGLALVGCRDGAVERWSAAAHRVGIAPAPCDTGTTGGWPADAAARVCADGTEAYAEIQPAIDASAPGDLIAVCPGTYGPIDIGRGVDVDIESIGGAAVTTIDGGWGPAVDSREGALVLRGFTITGQSVSPSEWEQKGGAFTVVESVVTVSDCVVQDVGGPFALFYDEDVLVMEDVVWRNNTTRWLWYLYQGLDARFVRNTIEGGVHDTVLETTKVDDLLVAQSTFANVTIDSALTAFILHPHLGTLTLANDVFWNVDDLAPGGGRLFSGAFEFRNNVIAGCNDGQFLPFDGSYSLFSDNGVNYLQIVDGDGNLAADPGFTDPANGDFRPLAGSPQVDAGDPGATWNDADGTRNDIGATGGSY